MAKQTQKERIAELEAELEGALEGISAVELVCSSIPIEWREIDGVRIGLDAAGSVVRIELPERLYGWNAE